MRISRGTCAAKGVMALKAKGFKFVRLDKVEVIFE